jgi:hypothetical protein
MLAAKLPRRPSRPSLPVALLWRADCLQVPWREVPQVDPPGSAFGLEKPDYRTQTGTSPVGQLSRPTGPQRGGTMSRGVCLRTSPSSNAHISPMAKIRPRAPHGSCAHACCSCGQIQITAEDAVKSIPTTRMRKLWARYRSIEWPRHVGVRSAWHHARTPVCP